MLIDLDRDRSLPIYFSRWMQWPYIVTETVKFSHPGKLVTSQNTMNSTFILAI